MSDRSEWHLNQATKLPGYSTPLGLTQAEEDNGVADNLVMGYGVGGWIVAVREHATAATSSLKSLSNGTGSTAFSFPVIQLPPAPTLPAGITAVKPGALQRIFDLAQTIKRKPGYTEAIGLDLGIVGPEAPPPPPPGGDAPPPRITVSAIPGDDNEYGRVKYYKDGHEAVVIESRRGGAWEVLVTSYKSPYIDNRPLLVPGQAEVREYRGRFYDKGAYTSGWCDVAKVTVGP